MILEAGKGIRMDPAKVEAITLWKFEDFCNLYAIWSFLGLCNFVYVFCHHLSNAAKPLTCLLKKDAPFIMGPDQKRAFETLKELVSLSPVLVFFIPGCLMWVELDSFRNATGRVIL